MLFPIAHPSEQRRQRAQNRSAVVTHTHQPGHCFCEQRNRVTFALEPGRGNFENILLETTQQCFHQFMHVTEVLVERRPTDSGYQHQFLDGQIAKRTSPQELQGTLENRLPRPVRLCRNCDFETELCRLPGTAFFLVLSDMASDFNDTTSENKSRWQNFCKINVLRCMTCRNSQHAWLK